MKRLILTATLLSSLFAKSQNLVGVSRQDIEFIAKTEHWKTTTSTTFSAMSSGGFWNYSLSKYNK